MMKNKYFKKVIAIAFILISAFMVAPGASAGHISDFYRDLKVAINCGACEEDNEREITIKLFSDGNPVDGTERTLNNTTGYKVVYEDLEIFRGEKSPDEVQYDVRVKDGNSYKIMPELQSAYSEVSVAEWVQVSPQDLQDSHEYVFMTENWNHEENGQGKYVLMNGRLGLSQTTPYGNYRIINGKKSYYYLDEAPADSDIWTLNKITADDPDYALYPNTYVLTNRDGKKLVLSEFVKDGYSDVIWRYSGKNGYNESENSYNTNKISFMAEPSNRGRFRMAAANNNAGELLTTNYIGVNHFYQIQSQTEPSYAAQFLAFEYVEQKAYYVSEMDVEYNLCPPENPQTVDNVLVAIIGIIFGVTGIAIVYRKNR